ARGTRSWRELSARAQRAVARVRHREHGSTHPAQARMFAPGHLPKGPPMNLADNLVRSAALHPDRPAVRLDDTVLTYAELDDRSARVARLLAIRGIEPGDRVALM